MNGRASSCVCTSTVTLRSCMHSSRPDCVFGEARLISSTSTTLAKIGPGRNSKRPSRWLKTFVPTTSAGSRSAVHCTRANCRSSARATDRASVVLPTPGRSSMRMCPSATMQTRTRSSSSLRTSTASVTASATWRRNSCALASSASPTEPGSSMLSVLIVRLLPRSSCGGPFSVAQVADHVEDYPRNLGLGRTRHMALAVGRDDRDLVLGSLEADVRARDVVDHDGIEPLARELVAPVGDRAVAVLGGEADHGLAGAAGGGEAGQDVRGTFERDDEFLVRVFLELVVGGVGGPVVGHGRGHEQHVRARELGLGGGLQLGGGGHVQV